MHDNYKTCDISWVYFINVCLLFYLLAFSIINIFIDYLFDYTPFYKYIFFVNIYCFSYVQNFII